MSGVRLGLRANAAKFSLLVGLNALVGAMVGLERSVLPLGALAATIAPRTVVWAGALALSVAGTLIALAFVRDTASHVAHEQAGHGERKAVSLRVAFVEANVRQPVLRACSQAGLVNNLNDALAWGLVPLYLAAHGASATRIGVIAAVYPGLWGVLQLGTGWLSDVAGRKPLIVLGMLVQAGALALLVAGGGEFVPSLVAAALLGIGTAFVYPTLLAAVSDVVEPRDRASVVGVYRFWRDSGFVAGALLVGFAADQLGSGPAIAIVAALTGVSGLLVAVTRWEPSAGGRLRLRRWLLSPTSSWPMRAPGVRSSSDGRASEGGTMRAIECPCGHHLEGADDEELLRLAREHVDRDHPEMQRTDEQLRERISADAYDLAPAR